LEIAESFCFAAYACLTFDIVGSSPCSQHFSMSSLGPKAKALIRCNRKKFEVVNRIANQASLLKWQKGNGEAPLHPPKLPNDRYRVILRDELPSEQSLNRRKHNDVILLGGGADGKLMYQQVELSTHRPPLSIPVIDTSPSPVQPTPDDFFDFNYGFDPVDYHIPPDGHPILHQ
jgi:hypothetical protein